MQGKGLGLQRFTASLVRHKGARHWPPYWCMHVGHSGRGTWAQSTGRSKGVMVRLRSGKMKEQGGGADAKNLRDVRGTTAPGGLCMGCQLAGIRSHGCRKRRRVFDGGNIEVCRSTG